jgi:hypothetical protein
VQEEPTGGHQLAGRYSIDRNIGEGGMSRRARYATPTRRLTQVALRFLELKARMANRTP